MPRAWMTDKLTPDMPLPEAAALILRVKLPEVEHYRKAAAAGTVDGIHDMRVAVKRLREAVRVLRPALSREARRKLLPVIEILNDTLGQVRDRDVLRQAFRKLGATEGTAEDLQALRKVLARERRQAHRDLLKLLADLKQSGFSRKYRRLMDELHETPASDQPTVAAFAAEAVGQRLDEVMAHTEDILGRHDSERFHRERIRVKKLKYALEPFLPLVTDCEAAYAAISDLQELMGLVHDLDVQREVIHSRAGSEGLTEGLRAALAAIALQRRSLLRQTRAHTRHMIEQDVAGALRGALADLQQAVPAGHP